MSRPDAAPVPGRAAADPLDRAAVAVREFRRTARLPGIAAALVAGGRARTVVDGVADATTGRPVTPYTPFRLDSLSKAGGRAHRLRGHLNRQLDHRRRRRPDRRGGRLTTTSAPTVRPITPDDVERVLVLWGSDAGDQLDMLSYDRWGPGVAVPARPSVAEVEALVQDPLDGVRELLHACVAGSATFCLVVEHGGATRGFVTGEVATQAGNEFRIGTLHELYVEPVARRRGLATALVEQAVAEFRRRGARQFRVEFNPDWREGMAFWRHARRWRQDAVVFNHYE